MNSKTQPHTHTDADLMYFSSVIDDKTRLGQRHHQLQSSCRREPGEELPATRQTWSNRQPQIIRAPRFTRRLSDAGASCLKGDTWPERKLAEVQAVAATQSSAELRKP